MAFNYVRETDRAIASVVVCGREFTKPEEQPTPKEETKPSETGAIPPVDTETPKEEEIPMAETKPHESYNTEVIKDENWTDPEPQPKTNIIVARIAALLSVKSLITIALTVAFIMLVVEGKELPDQFVSIYTMCISFFFGYQFKKAENK